LRACLPPSTASLKTARDAEAGPRGSARFEIAHAAERLCPEICLKLRPEVWASFQGGFSGIGPLTPPFWALAWPGGQALARYILDHPQIVADRTVVDWGAGCGLVAIAAAIAGARRVRAIDRDPRSIEAVRENARFNRVGQQVLAIKSELPSLAGGEGDVILAADLWYVRFDALRITGALRSLAKRGATVLMADTDRAFTPRGYLKMLARYSIETDPGIEQTRQTTAYVALLGGAQDPTDLQGRKQ
jgi:predicted nicotinamide N-methyase